MSSEELEMVVMAVCTCIRLEKTTAATIKVSAGTKGKEKLSKKFGTEKEEIEISRAHRADSPTTTKEQKEEF